jgi:hypothetical protein
VSARTLWFLTLVLAIVCWGALIAAYLSVSGQVHSTSADIRFTFDLFGIPLVEGFRVAGRLGLKFGWGAVVLLVGPFIVGMIASMWQIATYMRTHRTTDFEQES